MNIPSPPVHNTLIAVKLDEKSFGRGHPDIEHERTVAIFDLLEESVFSISNHLNGPYALHISLIDNRLVLTTSLHSLDNPPISTHIVSLTPFRRVVKDYHTICESYYEAIRFGTPSRIETVDMARRGIHNEAAEILMERLAGKIELDHSTARRMFTLISVLYLKAHI